jgi:hypothetical protein
VSGIPLPWKVKLYSKLALSRLGFSYGFWHRLGLFLHGRMDDPEYAISVFHKHREAGTPPPGFSALELGPGDSLANALIARAHGATKVWLIDQGDYANKNLSFYRDLAEALQSLGLTPPLEWRSVAEMLEACHATYLTEGLASLRTIPSGTVDFIWSQAVLEHIRKGEFVSMLEELRRVITPTGNMTHQIDLRDHLGGALNNLRFSDAQWESSNWAQAGFYTNRLRYSEIIEACQNAKFKITTLQIRRWDYLPTPKSKMYDTFKNMQENDLNIMECFILASPSGSSSHVI